MPVQLRFLETATALEELDLWILDSFWTLPREAILAMRRAVSSLASLKSVVISIMGSELEHYYSPLAVFAGAASIELLYFRTEGCRQDLPGESHDLARACFKRLEKLKSFTQCGTLATSHFAELLLELASTQLTSLSINLDFAAGPLMQHIAGFYNLRELTLGFHASSMRFLEPLFDLKKVTYLELIPTANPEFFLGHHIMHDHPDQAADHPDHEEAASTKFEQWALLSAKVDERARRVGLRAHVHVDQSHGYSSHFTLDNEFEV